MTIVRTVHTADLDPTTRSLVRGLLDAAFAGDITEDDWDHALGGVHALVWGGDDLVGHGSVVQDPTDTWIAGAGVWLDTGRRREASLAVFRLCSQLGRSKAR